jgi:hypothetical protein
MAATERQQLRALVWSALDEPDNLREHAERIVQWHYLRPLARGDIKAAQRLAAEALAYALERRGPTVGDMVALLRRTAV